MNCSSCNTENTAHARFCSNCGANLAIAQSGQSSEQNLNPAVSTDVVLEQAAVTEEMVLPAKVEAAGLSKLENQNSVMQPLSNFEKKSKIKPIFIIIPAIITALLLATVMAWVVLWGPIGILKSSISSHSLIYTKDNELYVRNIAQKKSFLVTSSIYDDNDELGKSGVYSSYAKQSKDGNQMVFLDKIDGDGKGNLYLRDTNIEKMTSKDADETGIKIASNVNAYPFFQFSEDGNRVFYMKEHSFETGGRLYVYDFKSEEKIDSDVSEFETSKDGQFTYYLKAIKDSKGDLYFKNTVKSTDKEKIDTGVVSIYKISEDGLKIYYKKYDDEKSGTYLLYVKEVGKDKKKLIEDADRIDSVNDKGIVTYFKKEKVKYYFDSLFEDDLKDSDGALSSPIEPSYSSFTKKEYYTDYWGYSYSYDTTDYDAYNIAYESYQEAKSNYEAKLERDYIRDYYKNNPLEVEREDLYIYDGEKEKPVDVGVGDVFANDQKGTSILYKKLNANSVTKKKVSEITGRYDVDETGIMDSLTPTKGSVILKTKSDKSITIAEDESIKDFHASDDLTKLYFISEFNEEKGYGKFMEYIVSSDSISAKNKIDEDVSSINKAGNDNMLVYLKNVKNDAGELYIKYQDKKEKVADDVKLGSIGYLEGSNNLYCLADYSKDDNIGKLLLINDFNKTSIADDVVDYYLRADDTLFYVDNFDKEKERGALWYKGNKEPLKIDEDVTNVLSY